MNESFVTMVAAPLHEPVSTRLSTATSGLTIHSFIPESFFSHPDFSTDPKCYIQQWAARLATHGQVCIRDGMWPAAAVATGDIPDIVRAIYLEYTVLRSSQEIGQFIEGLQTIGIATLMKRHPLVIKKMFVYNGEGNVTAQYLSELFVPFSHHEVITRGRRRRQLCSNGGIISRILKV